MGLPPRSKNFVIARRNSAPFLNLEFATFLFAEFNDEAFPLRPATKCVARMALLFFTGGSFKAVGIGHSSAGPVCGPLDSLS